MNKTQPNHLPRVMLLGRPNVGKSSIFTAITGKYTEIANYCMTTTTLQQGSFHHEKQCFELIDTPGTQDILSFPEQVLADLLGGTPAVIVHCIDATCLKQSLVVTHYLLQLGLPMVVALTSLDRAHKNGVEIEKKELIEELGVEVVFTNPLKGGGINELKQAIAVAKAPKKESIAHLPEDYRSLQADIAEKLPHDLLAANALASMIIRGEMEFLERQPQLFSPTSKNSIASLLQERPRATFLSVQKYINTWIDGVVERATSKKPAESSKLLQRAAHYSRSPLTGPIILLGIIYAMFLLVVNVANKIAGFLDESVWVPTSAWLTSIIPAGFWQDFFIGDYGVLSMGVANALLTVLPILSVFFLLYNTLEDIGYIANIAVLTKRLLGKIGLSGNSLMPLVLAFGCKTMATMTTKSLQSKKERYIAIFIIAFSLPCAAQLGLNLSILGMLGKGALFLVFGIFIISTLIVGVLLNMLWKDSGPKPVFLMELPPIRIPSLKMILRKTYHRILEFLEESFMVFIYAAFFLFVIDKIGVLQACKKFLQPLIEGFLGLPLSMVDALILCLARQEAGAAVILNLVRDGALDYRQSIVSVVLVTMFIPCSAHLAAMVKYIGSRDTFIMVTCKMAIAFVLAGTLNFYLTL